MNVWHSMISLLIMHTSIVNNIILYILENKVTKSENMSQEDFLINLTIFMRMRFNYFSCRQLSVRESKLLSRVLCNSVSNTAQIILASLGDFKKVSFSLKYF